jgi:integrase
VSTQKRKRWLGRVYLGLDSDGRQQFHYIGRFDTKRERDIAKARALVDRPWEKAAPGQRTCNEWADRFLDRMETGALRARGGRAYKDSSIDTARASLVAFRAEFGDRTPGSITRVEAEDWAARVQPSKLPMVVTLFNDLVRAEQLDRNRFLGLSHRGAGRRDKQPPSESEMVLLLEACGALGDYAPIMRALFTFGAYSLMRPGELFALDWELDVDLDAGSSGRIRVQRRLYRGRTDLPKSNKERTITIVAPARAALDSLLELRGYNPTGLVFRNKTGGRLTEPTLTAYWKEVRARACLDYQFYTATKHFGVWYMKVVRGLPDAAIAAQAGWSESAVTKMVATYGHAVDERRLDEIDAAFSDPVTGAESQRDTNRDLEPTQTQ